MTPLLSFEQVSRTFALDRTEVAALHRVSLALHHGEFAAVAGPSGSGKSTLLHLAGCLDVPTHGTVRIDGVDTRTLDPAAQARLRRRRIGFVFQTFNLIPVFTALENVEYPLLLEHLPQAERRHRASEALASVGLSHRARQRPDLLSGGERQRVAVARALVHRPGLVLADEPTANLDTRNANEIIALCRRLNEETGATFVFSTHDPRLLEQAGRVIHIQDGRIREGVHESVLTAGL
jgi:putative ABC transport system ATP-binding protein